MIFFVVNYFYGVRIINLFLFFIYFGDLLGIIYLLKFILFICFCDVLLIEIELYGLLYILRIGIFKFIYFYFSIFLYICLKFIKKVNFSDKDCCLYVIYKIFCI